MAFPDRIERTISLTQSPAVVWAALTTAQGLGTWLGDKDATIDLRPGGAGKVNWSSGDRAELRVERQFQIDRIANQAAQNSRHALNDHVQTQYLRCQHLPATERQ